MTVAVIINRRKFQITFYCFFQSKCTLFIFALLLLFTSCNERLSELSIHSNLQEGDSISVALYSKTVEQYITVNDLTVTSADVIHKRLDIPLPDSLIKNISVLSITIHHCSDSIFAISSIELKNIGEIYPQDIMNTLIWQYGLKFEVDPKSNSIKSNINVPAVFPVYIANFYQRYPVTGIQLFHRFILIATLLILNFILCKQATSQRFILVTIALFISSIPFKIGYTEYFVGLMLLTIILTFIRDKSRCFIWQPIFYVFCAMYLLDVIGLSYTGDFYSGFKRLDRVIQLVLFPITFSMIQLTKNNIILLLRFFVWSVIVFCAFAFLSYVTIAPEFTWDVILLYNRWFYAKLLMLWPAHPHPSYLSSILLMAIPVALYLRYQDGKHITLVEMLLGVILPMVFTILCSARVGMVIALALPGMGYLFYCRFRTAIKWGLVLIGIVAGGILLCSFPNANDHFFDPIRSDLRKTAISAVKEKPVFGWGTGASKSLIHSEERAHSLGIATPYDYNQFHNQYLEDWVQFGILGILILLVLFCWMFWVGCREKNFLLLSLLFIYTVFCWTESVLYVSKGVLPFTFWLCLLMSNRKNSFGYQLLVK